VCPSPAEERVSARLSATTITIDRRRSPVPSLIYNGVTYGISHTRFEATRELLARFAEGQTMRVAMSLIHGDARHHLFITPGVPITLVE
jgi:hypothetical protein